MDQFTENIKKLIELLKNAHHAVAFTGAGISTLSGIRDFRGKNGVYLQPWHGYAVEDILSLPLFLQHPELYYRWAEEFIYRLEEFHPSIVHQVLAKMEGSGMLHALYTQNIDLLHQKARSKNVYELHGSPARHSCLACGRKFDYTEISSRVLQGKVPHCPCSGLIKPEIVFYGENLDEALLEQAYEEMSRTDLLLVLGSSLTVYPAAGLPEICARNGGKVVIVNAQATPFDNIAVLRFDDLLTLFTQLDRQLFYEE